MLTKKKSNSIKLKSSAIHAALRLSHDSRNKSTQIATKKSPSEHKKQTLQHADSMESTNTEEFDTCSTPTEKFENHFKSSNDNDTSPQRNTLASTMDNLALVESKPSPIRRFKSKLWLSTDLSDAETDDFNTSGTLTDNDHLKSTSDDTENTPQHNLTLSVENLALLESKPSPIGRFTSKLWLSTDFSDAETGDFNTSETLPYNNHINSTSDDTENTPRNHLTLSIENLALFDEANTSSRRLEIPHPPSEATASTQPSESNHTGNSWNTFGTDDSRRPPPIDIFALNAQVFFHQAPGAPRNRDRERQHRFTNT